MSDELVKAAVGIQAAGFWAMACRDVPISRAVGKLIETVGDQLGQAMQSGNDWLKAKVEASKALTEVRTEIKIQSEKDQAVQRQKLSKWMSQEERAVVWQTIQQNRRQRNIERVLDRSAEELQQTPELDVSDRKVDPDWMTKLFNHVQDISDEDMQTLWARLLAGEVKQPGSYRRQTLQVLNEMSKEDGEIFARLCSVLWHGNDNSIWSLTDREWVHAQVQGKFTPLTFDYSDCLRMSECRLVDIADTYQTIWMSPAGFYLSYFGDGYAFRKEGTTENRVQLKAGTFHLTAVGMELSRVVAAERNDAYLNAILSSYRDQGWTINRARLVDPNHVEIITD